MKLLSPIDSDVSSDVAMNRKNIISTDIVLCSRIRYTVAHLSLVACYFDNNYRKIVTFYIVRVPRRSKENFC